ILPGCRGLSTCPLLAILDLLKFVNQRKPENWAGPFPTELIGVGAIHTDHLAVIGQGIVATQSLGNGDKSVLRNSHRSAVRNSPCRTIGLSYHYTSFVASHISSH